MIKRKVATIVFYDEDNFMIQDRKKYQNGGKSMDFLVEQLKEENIQNKLSRENLVKSLT